ncbi:MAG TPA: hypothetical protein VH107_06710 [Lacipirellulaceae bacterium]|nr:hypothetical protein [Lacipirellulaceae bacterium]
MQLRDKVSETSLALTFWIVACLLSISAISLKIGSLNNIGKRVIIQSFALAERQAPDQLVEDQLMLRASTQARASDGLAMGTLLFVVIGAYFHRGMDDAGYLKRLPEIATVLLLIDLLLHFVII